MHTTQIEDREAIFAIEKSYDHAWNQGEAGILASFFTSDAVIINPHGEVAEGKNEFENLMSTLFHCRFKGSNHKSKILRVEKFQSLTDSLTERQEKILWIALKMGFYEFPRKINTKELSEKLGISMSTFSEITRRGLRNLLESYYIEK
jgi:uncharacterized protein (TIGR02246 family)